MVSAATFLRADLLILQSQSTVTQFSDHLAMFGHAGCLNGIHPLSPSLDGKERQNTGPSSNIQNNLQTS